MSDLSADGRTTGEGGRTTDSTAGGPTTGGEMIDTGVDLHTHSTQTDGADDMATMAAAAVAAGLHTWGLSDHVRASTTWLPEYVVAVRALRYEPLQIRCGVEAKILDRTGRLDLPPDLPPLDYVLVADHQYPGTDGPEHPDAVREQLAAGRVTTASVLEQLVLATAAAVQASPYPPIVAHLFSLLPKCGLAEQDVPEDLLDALAAACRAADAAVEVNEKWRCPSAGVLARLHSRGVRLVAGTDAHRAADVGRFGYLHDAVPAP